MRRETLKILGASLLGMILAPGGLRAGDLGPATLYLGGDPPSPDEILRGPVSAADVGPGEVVDCVYWEFRPGGPIRSSGASGRRRTAATCAGRA